MFLYKVQVCPTYRERERAMHSVVLVDDEPWVAMDILRSVDWGRFGFQVAATYSRPLEALPEMRRLAPALSFVDIRMPDLDGLSFIERCQAFGLSGRYVILSGHADFDYMRRAMRLGVTDYCLKPIDPEEMHALLARIAGELDVAGGASGHFPPDAQFSQLLEYVRFHAGETLRLSQVAGTFNFNRNYLCALFRKHTGLSFVQYLTQIRLENSRHLLRNTDLSIEEIARRNNLGDAPYFSRIFKRYTRVTPAAYRRGAQAEEGEHGADIAPA